MRPVDSGFDLHHEADLVRAHIESWTHTKLGDRVHPVTRIRVLAALDLLERAAAREEAA